MTDDTKPDFRLLKMEQPDVLRKNLDQMARAAPYMIEMYAITAKLHRARYLALLEQGFNEAQALELCKVLY